MCVEISYPDMKSQKFKVCPYVNNPMRGCYCLDMSSRNIEKVVKYCSGNYQQCAIYIESRK